MAEREIRAFESTWLDKKFRKSFAKLRSSDKKRFESKLGDLIDRLRVCRHPISDPELSAFRPTPYHLRLASSRDWALAEFRLGSTWRVIVAFREPGTLEAPSSLILLVAATLDHDHDRLQALIRRAGREI